MRTVYIVTVNGKVSSLAYNTLEEAQEFVANRVKPEDLDGQEGYYNVFSSKDYQTYVIADVRVA